MNAEPDMLEAALAYAKKELSVIPVHSILDSSLCSCGNKKCRSKGKHPRGSWKSQESKRLTEADLRSYWKKHPDSNVGVVTGSISQIIVIDIDGQKGIESLKTVGLTLQTMPATPTARTGGGGYHLYYKYSEGAAKTKASVLDKVDIRANGGLVVAPPSIHLSGKRYEWLKGRSLDDLAIADFNFSLLTKPKVIIEKGPEWHTKALEGVGEGERNDTATRLAGRYAGKGISQEEAWLTLSAWNQKNEPPMDEKELKVVIESIYSKENRSEAPPLIKLEEVEVREVEWLWYPYIPLGKLTLMDGDPGECKSWFALAIASRVSLGELGKEPANVIVASLEDDEEDAIKPRLENMGADIKRIRSIDKNFPLTFDNEGLKILEDYIKQERAELLILDPILGYMAGADIHRANEMRGITSQLRRIASENRCAMLGIRHLTKPGKGLATKAIYKGLGSIDLIAAARSGLLVGHMEDEDGNMTERGMTHIKSNYAPPGDPVGFEILNLGGHGVFSWNMSCNVTSRGMLGVNKKGTKADEAIAWLRGMLADGVSIPSTEIYRDAEEEGFSEGTLDIAKRRLHVKSVKNGVNWDWTLPKKREKPS